MVAAAGGLRLADLAAVVKAVWDPIFGVGAPPFSERILVVRLG